MFPLNYDNTGVTVELGDIVASGVDVWAFDYPVPADTVTYNGKTAKVPFNKKEFEQKIIDHYRFRQIGQETVGRWLHYFRSRIREIMPYYVQLYEFEAKWFNVDDPLESYNLTETFQEESSGSGRTTGSGSSESASETTGTNNTSKTGTVDHLRKFSDTPQGSISNLDGYMTEATQEDTTSSETGYENSSGSATVTGSDSSETETENTGTTSHTLTRRGNIGVQPLGGEVQNIREAFINIDLMVINELKDLFIQVY